MYEFSPIELLDDSCLLMDSYFMPVCHLFVLSIFLKVPLNSNIVGQTTERMTR